jgi:hypothetical protein
VDREPVHERGVKVKKSEQKALVAALKAVAGEDVQLDMKCLYEVKCTVQPSGRTHTCQDESYDGALRKLVKAVALADVPMKRGVP